MEKTGFIVGIDVGTFKIVGLLGRKNEQGVVSILASESITSDSCVKHGVVYNIDEAAGKIRKLINLLENKSGRKIGKVYVSIAGMSLRAMEYTVVKDLAIESEIQFAVIDQLENKARVSKPEFMTNYSVVAPEFFLDGRAVEDPLGKTATVIEGRYRLIVGRPNIKNNLVKCITEKNNIEIAGYIVGPVAAGAIVLDESDKQEGCALIDFGGGTTTISIYKDGLLRYMSVIPFGGRTITKDVQELGLIDSTAEASKIKYGNLSKEKNKPAALGLTSIELDIKELNRVLQLRQEEIVVNVQNQIAESGYQGRLDAGVVIIGGASQMKGLTEFLEEKLQMPVKNGVPKRLYINNAADLLQNPAFAQCLGLLLFANENCERTEIPQYLDTNLAHPKGDVAQQRVVKDKSKQAEPQMDEEDDDEFDYEETPKKKSRKQKTLFDFFGKIQNLGGTMFKDED